MTWIVRSAVTLYDLPREVGRWPEEDHDRAQDAFYDEKLAHPNHIVEMSEVGVDHVYVLHADDKINSIFSRSGDAEAWAHQLQNRFGIEKIEIIAHLTPDAFHQEPPKEIVRPTVWERLLADD